MPGFFGTLFGCCCCDEEIQDDRPPPRPGNTAILASGWASYAVGERDPLVSNGVISKHPSPPGSLASYVSTPDGHFISINTLWARWRTSLIKLLGTNMDNLSDENIGLRKEIIMALCREEITHQDIRNSCGSNPNPTDIQRKLQRMYNLLDRGTQATYNSLAALAADTREKLRQSGELEADAVEQASHYEAKSTYIDRRVRPFLETHPNILKNKVQTFLQEFATRRIGSINSPH